MEKLLVSACLLGVACRYDGQSLELDCCRARALRLGERFQLVPVCPEQLAGMTTPRPPVFFSRLPGEDPAAPLGEVTDGRGIDHTDRLLAGAAQVLYLARLLGVRRALLKERSPSCGVRAVYRFERLAPGRGITAALLARAGVEVISDEEEHRLREDS